MVYSGEASKLGRDEVSDGTSSAIRSSEMYMASEYYSYVFRILEIGPTRIAARKRV